MCGYRLLRHCLLQWRLPSPTQLVLLIAQMSLFLLNLIKFIITGILDAIIISRARAGDHTSVTNHALVRMTCNLVSAACGLGYFRWIVRRMKFPLKEQDDALSQARPCLAALILLVRHGIWTFGESMVRNSLYLWLVHSIIRIGKDYAIAWGVFNTMRGGLLMVPLQALEASTLTFIGHAWGVWRSKSLKSQTEAEAGLGEGKTTPIEKPPNKPEAELKDIFCASLSPTRLISPTLHRCYQCRLGIVQHWLCSCNFPFLPLLLGRKRLCVLPFRVSLRGRDSAEHVESKSFLSQARSNVTN